MKLIDKLITLSTSLQLNFTIEQSDWYLLSISARVKSAKQLGKDETDDEDLRIEMDGQKFPQLLNPQRYLDSPAAFSGGKLHNLLETIYFVFHLVQGGHILSLIPDKGASIENVEVVKLENFPHLRLELSQQAEKGNNRPWLVFALVNLGLKTLKLAGKVKWRFPDGDDLKLIIDGRVKKNTLSLLHRNWIFASNALNKILGREKFEQTFEENLPLQDLHYLEIWADENPTLNYVELELLSEEPKEQTIQTYRPGPNGKDYNRFDQEIFNAIKYWNDFFLSQEYPPPEPLDSNLIKAMIYVESRMGYGATSTSYSAYPDVMQVWDLANPARPAILGETPANEFISKTQYGHISYSYPSSKKPPKVETPEESIFWGTRWLLHKAQAFAGKGQGELTSPYARWWLVWKEATRLYGPGTTDYVDKIWNLYEKGVDPDGGKNLF